MSQRYSSPTTDAFENFDQPRYQRWPGADDYFRASRMHGKFIKHHVSDCELTILKTPSTGLLATPSKRMTKCIKCNLLSLIHLSARSIATEGASLIHLHHMKSCRRIIWPMEMTLPISRLLADIKHPMMLSLRTQARARTALQTKLRITSHPIATRKHPFSSSIIKLTNTIRPTHRSNHLNNLVRRSRTRGQFIRVAVL